MGSEVCVWLERDVSDAWPPAISPVRYAACMDGPPPGFEASATQVSELDLDASARPWVGPGGRVMERLELHLT